MAIDEGATGRVTRARHNGRPQEVKVRNGIGGVRAETIAVFARLNDMGGKLDDSERRHHTNRPPIERRQQQERHQCVFCSLHDPLSSLYQVSLCAATDDYSWMQQKRIPSGCFSPVQGT